MDNQAHNRSIHLVLEGNVGAGKSTLLRILQQQRNVEIIPEPTDKWQNVTGQGNLLDLYYKDAKRWAYTFQSNVLITRVQSIHEHETAQQYQNNDTIYIYERSVYCDRFCFTKNCYEQGYMSDLEWHIYKDCFLWISNNLVHPPHGFIYLRTDPEIALMRTKRRHRSEEGSISINYLQILHQKHEEWLIEKKVSIPAIQDVPILVLDCNGDFEHDPVVQQRLLTTIDAFIAKQNIGNKSIKKNEKTNPYF